MSWEAWVGLGALVLAVGNMGWNYWQDRRAQRLARRARLRASVEFCAGADTGCDQIVIENDGPGTASHIRTFIDGESLLHHDFFQMVEKAELRGNLGPGSRYTYPVSWDTTEPKELKLTGATSPASLVTS